MPNKEEVRKKLADLIENKGLNFRKVSLMIGKGDSYIQRFIKLGLPERLPEDARIKIANILGVDEQELTDLPKSLLSKSSPNSVSIKIIDAVACCGTGIEALQENVVGTWDIPLQKYRDFSTAKPENVYMLQVEGDSMTPTLNSGDWALADTSQNFISSDGLYLIRMASGLAVKRIQSGLNDITIKSDNPAYGEINANVGEIAVLGRVIYILNAQKVG
jgi:SOS-response transcriptional repressor LexA